MVHLPDYGGGVSTIDPASVELGLDTFGDVTIGADGTPEHPAVVLRNIVEQAVLADRVGLNFIGLGEHHRDDFAITAPDVVLAAIAARTEHIRLGSAVTVLSSDDPIRVFERFSTVDALSNGRAEIIIGRGSFTESFGLFGFDLDDYERLFAEKLDLLSHVLTQEPVTWSGSIRPPLSDQRVFPPTESGQLKVWIGVGGTPQSVVRAAHYRMPLMLAIIGGAPAQFVPLANYYRELLAADGVDQLPIGMHSPGHVAETDEQARDELFDHFQAQRDRIGRERGWPPTTRIQFERDASPEGALYVGSPETVARKIATNLQTLGVSRFDLKYANGAMPHDQLMRSIELFGTRVAPLVRDLLS